MSIFRTESVFRLQEFKEHLSLSLSSFIAPPIFRRFAQLVTLYLPQDLTLHIHCSSAYLSYMAKAFVMPYVRLLSLSFIVSDALPASDLSSSKATHCKNVSMASGYFINRLAAFSFFTHPTPIS